MYYRLTYLIAGGSARVGDSVACGGSRTLSIGQDAGADLVVPPDDDREPLTLATIVPLGNDRLAIARRSDFHDISVGGKPLSVARQLTDGDKITIKAGEKTLCALRFNVKKDGVYDAAAGVIYNRRGASKALWLVVPLLALLTAGLVYVASRGSDSLSKVNLEGYNESLYHVGADSVYLLCDTTIGGVSQTLIVRAIELEHPTAGTCFLTDSGYFVTARHCIEPWINDDGWDGTPDSKLMSPEVALATLAETRNRLSDTDRYRVVAHVIVTRGVERYDYRSSDFAMNKSRDQVICLGSERKPIYWRTIFPLAHRRDMELGDFAYVRSPRLMGAFALATASDLTTFDTQTDKEIAVLGFPVTDADRGDAVTRVYGNSQHLEFDEQGDMAGCIAMSASVNPGNSGGPVLARVGGDLKVVGIVSKGDGQAAQGTFWAVPVSEVTTLMSRGGAAVEPPARFRR